MARPSTNPLDGVDRLLVDGTNLLHALARRPSGAAPLPPAALVGRLRAAIPSAVAIELVLDGPPDPGMRGTRVASGLIVRHAGRRNADEVLMWLVDQARDAAGPRGADNILVVTDDRDLRYAIGRRGGKTAGARWLTTRLERTTIASPTTGNRRPRVASGKPGVADTTGFDDDAGDDAQPTGWRPGRGATTKHGNPKRQPRRVRRPGSSG